MSWASTKFFWNNISLNISLGMCICVCVEMILLYKIYNQFSLVQSLSCVWLFETPWTTAHQAFRSITSSQSLLKFMSFESVMPSNHLILYCPLLLLPSIFPSIRVFSSESGLHTRWPKHWSFSFNISSSNEHPGLISFRMDWLDLLAVQGTLKSLLQHHSSKPPILQHTILFMAQLSHPYMNTGKTIALTRQTFVGKVMSLLFIYLFLLFYAISIHLVFLNKIKFNEKKIIKKNWWQKKEKTFKLLLL